MKNNFIKMILLTVVFLISSCGGKSDSIKNNEVEHHEEHENSNTVSLTAEQIKSINLEFSVIEKKQLTASLKANGILNVPNQNKATVNTLMGGIIKSIFVQSGKNVEKGQIIATIANTSIITMQEEYLATCTKLNLYEIEFKRQQELQAGNATALKTLQTTESELNILKTRKASLQKQLEQIGLNIKTLTSENIQSLINITSPISGAISTISVNIGSYVDANNPIAEVIDNSQLHLDLFVYEKDLNKLKEGQTIHFTLTNNPGKEYDAKVYAISNTFEQNSKAIVVHAMVEGEKNGLIDGMNITALVSLENATVDALPTEAIVNYQGQDYIFVVTNSHNATEHKHDKEHEHTNEHKHVETKIEIKNEEELEFERIPVRKGTTDIGYSEVTLLKDVPANAKIVTKGAFFILAKMTNSGEHSH